MSKQPIWHAVYTRPSWEKKVAALLEKKGIEQYCPTQDVYRQWSDRKKLVQVPLFTSYVFVRVTEADIAKVKQTDGVLTMVYWMGSPAVIKDAEIEAIRQFVTTYQNIKLEAGKVNVNDTVRIIEGPFESMEGQVKEVLHHSIRVILPSLGYSMIAQVPNSQVSKIKNDKNKEEPDKP